MIAKGTSRSALDHILWQVLLPRLATLRQLRLGGVVDGSLRDIHDAWDGLAVGDHGDDLGEGWRVRRGLLGCLGLLGGGASERHFGGLGM